MPDFLSKGWDKQANGEGECYEYELRPPRYDYTNGFVWAVTPENRARRAPAFDIEPGKEVPDELVWIGGWRDPRGQWEVHYADGSAALHSRPQRVVGNKREKLHRDGKWMSLVYGKKAHYVRLVPWDDEPASPADPRDARMDAIAAERERAEKAEAALARVARRLARVTREMDLAIAALAGIGEGAGGD